MYVTIKTNDLDVRGTSDNEIFEKEKEYEELGLKLFFLSLIVNYIR